MKATATEVQNNFGKYLKFSLNEDAIITRNRKEIACLSKYDPDFKNKFLICEGSAAYSYEKPIKATYEEFQRLVKDSRKGGYSIILYPHFTHNTQYLRCF